MLIDGILILGTKRIRQAVSLEQSLAEEESSAEFEDLQAGRKIGHCISGVGPEIIPISSALPGRQMLKAAANGSVSRTMAENSSLIYNRYSYKFSVLFVLVENNEII